MSLTILPAIPEAIIVRRDTPTYEGPIELGAVFAWHPDNVYARELLVVTRITSEIDSGFFRRKIWCRRIDNEPFSRGDTEVWNPEDLFRDSVFETLMKPHSVNPDAWLTVAEGAAVWANLFKGDRQ